ncbi:MAG: DM13 domain-containing protein [Parashewanella sp.]
MKLKTITLLIVSHLSIAILGFMGGIYALPILIAPPSPSDTEIEQMSTHSIFNALFIRELKGSDALHWGQGKVSINKDSISFMGKLAPGPDYKLYLSPKFVENETEFNQIKSTMVQVGNVSTFNNFIVPLPKHIDAARYNSIIIWCETFGEFITAAKYR